MVVGSWIRGRYSSRVALFALVAASGAFVGCGGADQTTGTQAEVDAQAQQRQDDMRKFYAKNPLPKPRRQP